jgi:hypothetical protein
VIIIIFIFFRIIEKLQKENFNNENANLNKVKTTKVIENVYHPYQRPIVINNHHHPYHHHTPCAVRILF